MPHTVGVLGLPELVPQNIVVHLTCVERWTYLYLENWTYPYLPVLIFGCVYTISPFKSTGVSQSVSNRIIIVIKLPCVCNKDCAQTATHYIWGAVRDRS